jgi:hypothetical protein
MKRIRGLKQNRNQMKIMSKNHMDHDQWLVQKVLPDRLECIHRLNGNIKPAFYEVAMIK